MGLAISDKKYPLWQVKQSKLVVPKQDSLRKYNKFNKLPLITNKRIEGKNFKITYSSISYKYIF